MKTDAIIVRYGEIALKGKNRQSFENRLVKNIKSCFGNHNAEYSSMQKEYGRIVISTESDGTFLKQVFGIASFSPAIKIPADIGSIKQSALSIAKENGVGRKSFRVSTQRINKDLPFDSLEMNKNVGEIIFETLSAKVDLKNPEVNVGIELIDDAYIFTEAIQGFGGLPLGIESPVVALIDDEKSILAAWLMMKRGAPVFPLGFEQINIELLRKYAHGINLDFKIIKDIDELDAFARNRGITSICTGQTLKEFKELDTDLVVFRPLLTYSAEEIDELMRKIK